MTEALKRQIYEQINRVIYLRASASFAGDRDSALACTEVLLDLWAALGENCPRFPMSIHQPDGKILWLTGFNGYGDAVYKAEDEERGASVEEARTFNALADDFIASNNGMDQRYMHPDYRFYREQHATAILGIGTAFNGADPLLAEVLLKRMTQPSAPLTQPLSQEFA